MTARIPFADEPESDIATGPAHYFSPKALAESLLLLAQEADRWGHQRNASRLIVAAHAMLDEEMWVVATSTE